VKPILHPTRFSAEDQGAFRIACAIAPALNRELVILHVADRKKLHRCRDYRRDIDERLEALRLSEPSLQITTLVSSGRPSSEIVSVSRDHACSLIVMRPSRRRWWNGLVGNSLSEQVKLRAGCPVLWLEMKRTPYFNCCDDMPSIAAEFTHSPMSLQSKSFGTDPVAR
jgi:nucleotide-binding universal stress UspA family protein